MPCLVVVSNEIVVGILQKADYIELLSIENRISLISPVHQLMNKHFYFASPEHGLEEAILLMKKYQLQILPIVDKDRFLGVFSYATLLDCLAVQHSDTIRNLFTYITGFDNFEPQIENIQSRDLIKN
jgi:predicted transcriptional regulator